MEPTGVETSASTTNKGTFAFGPLCWFWLTGSSGFYQLSLATSSYSYIAFSWWAMIDFNPAESSLDPPSSNINSRSGVLGQMTQHQTGTAHNERFRCVQFLVAEKKLWWRGKCSFWIPAAVITEETWGKCRTVLEILFPGFVAYSKENQLHPRKKTALLKLSAVNYEHFPLLNLLNIFEHLKWFDLNSLCG